MQKPYRRNRITVYLTEQDYQKIRKHAEIFEQSESSFCEKGILTYLKELEKYIHNNATLAA